MFRSSLCEDDAVSFLGELGVFVRLEGAGFDDDDDCRGGGGGGGGDDAFIGASGRVRVDGASGTFPPGDFGDLIVSIASALV